MVVVVVVGGGVRDVIEGRGIKLDFKPYWFSLHAPLLLFNVSESGTSIQTRAPSQTFSFPLSRSLSLSRLHVSISLSLSLSAKERRPLFFSTFFICFKFSDFFTSEVFFSPLFQLSPVRSLISFAISLSLPLAPLSLRPSLTHHASLLSLSSASLPSQALRISVERMFLPHSLFFPILRTRRFSLLPLSQSILLFLSLHTLSPSSSSLFLSLRRGP